MITLKKLLSAAMAMVISGGLYTYANVVVPQVHRDMHRELMQQQELMSFFQTMVDSVETIEGETPFELHPMLDLYGEWNDSFNPTANPNAGPLKDQYEISMKGWVAPIKGMITSPYGWRRRRMHKGEDIKLYVGDTVRAAFDGRVRIRKFERRGYGYYYVIRHENGLETIYGHLSKQIVEQDAYVRAGQAIGLGGSTGRSTGPHLHFEMRFMGIALDPSKLINLDTFEPHDSVYVLNRHQAEWAQNNQGKRGATYRGQKQPAQRQQPAQTQRSNAGSSNAKASTNNQSNNAAASKSGVHTVRKGDTLGAIARRYGTTVPRLCRLNGIKADSRLNIGQKLRYK